MLPVAFVDHVKMIHVQHDGIHVQFLVELVKLLCVTVKIFPVVQACQGIPLRGMNDLLIFRKLDDARHPRQNHPGLGIRLGNKIDGTQAQAFNFRCLIRGEHDYRDALQFRLFLQVPEQIHAGHDRHHQIQQHNRNGFPVILHDLQGLFAVFGIENLKIIFQDRAQDGAVDLLVIRNQDRPLPVGGMEFLVIFQHERCPLFHSSRRCSSPSQLSAFLIRCASPASQGWRHISGQHPG